MHPDDQPPEGLPPVDETNAVLPLFPLDTVLMPGCPLPLHVFEPRYRRMVDDVTGEGGAYRFGVVALTSGLEVDTGLDEAAPQFARIGTVAQVLTVEDTPGGSYGIFTGGTRRFRIDRVIDGVEPYLQAEVTFLAEPEVDDIPMAQLAATIALSAEYDRLVQSVAGDTPHHYDPFPVDAVLQSYRLAAEAALPVAEHQQLLEMATAGDRLSYVQRFLRREVVLMRRSRTISIPQSTLLLPIRLN